MQNDYYMIYEKQKELCMDRESHPGLPCGRREFYHWTIHAYISNLVKHWKRLLEVAYGVLTIWYKFDTQNDCVLSFTSRKGADDAPKYLD